MKLAQIFLVTVLMAMVVPMAKADQMPQFTNYLQWEIYNGSQALGAADRASSAGTDSYYLQRIMLKAQAIVGIDVPWIALFQIIPEVELIWQKPVPKGWAPYKP